MDEINKKIELSEDDIKKFNLANSYEGKTLSKIITMSFLIFTCLFAPEIYGDFIWPVVIMVIILILAPLFLIISSKKMYKDNSFIKKTANYSINEESLTITYDDKSSYTSVKWNEVKKVRILNEFILVFLDSRQCFVIPLRYLSDEEITTIRDIIFKNEDFKKEILKFEKKKSRSIYFDLVMFVIFVAVTLFYMLVKFNLIFLGV